MVIKKESDCSDNKGTCRESSKVATKPWSEASTSTTPHGVCSSGPLTPPRSPTSHSLPGQRTRITIKYDVGFSNSLSLRGEGAGLSWSKGVKLKNVKNDEWVWETDQPFVKSEFKVLINDVHFEHGANHKLVPGANLVYTPTF